MAEIKVFSDLPPWLPWPGRAARQLATLHGLSLNFRPADLPAVARDAWYVDDYRHPLPAEPPGTPVSGGSFGIAVRLLGDYEFADPKRVRVFYRADVDLLGRTMLLELRYVVVRLRVGVRIDEVFDERREVDGRAAQVRGWAYRTLEGHLERGQLDYEVWKWLDTGEVEFRIHAVSQVAEIRNPIWRWGFGAVGRGEQVGFARCCGERMDRLVRAVLANGEEAKPRPARTGPLRISPSLDDG
jgi:uncharacterized protein (UPF0548 family)